MSGENLWRLPRQLREAQRPTPTHAIDTPVMRRSARPRTRTPVRSFTYDRLGETGTEHGLNRAISVHPPPDARGTPAAHRRTAQESLAETKSPAKAKAKAAPRARASRSKSPARSRSASSQGAAVPKKTAAAPRKTSSKSADFKPKAAAKIEEPVAEAVDNDNTRAYLCEALFATLLATLAYIVLTGQFQSQ